LDTKFWKVKINLNEIEIEKHPFISTPIIYCFACLEFYSI
jgi:hypothetical protein